MIAADVDGDGATDLIVTQLQRPPVVLRNVGGNKNHSLRIALTGLADNKTAIGTKVEVFAGGQWQKFEVAGGSGYLSQGSTEIVAGLGQTEHGGRGAAAVADGGSAGRDRHRCGQSAAWRAGAEGAGSAGELVSDAVCVGWEAVRVRLGRDWRGGGRALGVAGGDEPERSRRVDQGGWGRSCRRGTGC